MCVLCLILGSVKAFFQLDDPGVDDVEGDPAVWAGRTTLGLGLAGGFLGFLS